MKTKELMIGNLVLFENQIFEIQSLSADIPNLKPIPITLELLDKIGLRIENKPNQDIEYYYKDSSFNLVHKTFFNVYYFCFDNIVLKKINFIHEVQNLFYLLDNIDLKLKND